MAAEHPIFNDIHRGNLEAVKQHVLADSAVLKETTSIGKQTPLLYAIQYESGYLPIAHWLIEHRGQHDVNTKGP